MSTFQYSCEKCGDPVRLTRDAYDKLPNGQVICKHCRRPRTYTLKP